MKVLVTGSNGFIGQNLIAHLNEMEDIEVVTYDKDDDFSKIVNEIDKIDFIFHLAGVNRPVNSKEFYEGNSDLTKQIVDLIKDKNIPLLITSSIQATKDNDYGKSKKIAEDYIKDNLQNYYIYRLHNVFGKWCRPNYNSVIATFCYNIAHDLEIKVDNRDTELELIYIDDIILEFINVLKGNKPDEIKDNICYINPRYKASLGYISDKLYEFKENMKSIYVPNTGNDFIKKLFATYVSYMELDKMAFSAVKNVDERGAFIELVRTKENGQFSVSFIQYPVIIEPHTTEFIHTGIAIEIPDGYFGAVFARSGLASKQGLRPANCVGVCDSRYRGEYMIALHNDCIATRTVSPGDRIAQLVVMPYLNVEFEEVDELSDTERGDDGFGSTGV